MIDFGPMNTAVLDTFREESGVVEIDGSEVAAIYDSRHYASDLGEQGGSALVTSITVTDAVAEGVTVEVTEIVARGVTYVAKDKRPLGEGLTTIELRAAP